jgi:hypothetical protein
MVWTSKTTWIENNGILRNFSQFLWYLRDFNEIKSVSTWIDAFKWRPQRDNRDLVAFYGCVLVCSAWCFCSVGSLICLYTYIDRLCKIFDYVTSACVLMQVHHVTKNFVLFITTPRVTVFSSGWYSFCNPQTHVLFLYYPKTAWPSEKKINLG